MADSKRFKRRLLAMLLSLTMLLTFFPVSAFADNDSAGTSQLLDKMSEVTEPVNDEGEKEPDVYEQQLEELQRDAKAEAKLYFSKGSDAEQLPSFDDYQKALQYVRSQMVIRENNIDIVVTDAVYQQMDMGEMEDGCQDVLEHTGNPKEGDSFNLVYNTASGEKLSDSSWKVSYYFAYWDTYEQTVAVDAEAEKLVTQLGLKDSSKSDYDKVKAIYDYITANVRYNYDALDEYIPDAHNAYGAFVLHYCVCQGYALMFYRLCLEAGLDCRCVNGTVGEAHQWNIVKVDGKWYLADTTWDEGVSEESYSYFLRGKNDFGHANTDDNFHRDPAFAEKYPVSDYRYGYTPISVEAPEYTLITIDNKTVTTKAENGRAKVLIFFYDKCVFSTALLNEMSEKSFPGVDIIAANFGNLDTLDLVGDFLPAKIPGVYCSCENNYDAMRNIELKTGLINSVNDRCASPTIFLINKDNKIILAQHGLDNSLLSKIENMLVDKNAPPPKTDTTDYGTFITMGVCGDNAVWRYYNNGTLRISGKGALFDITTTYKIDWYDDVEIAYYKGAGKYSNNKRLIEPILYNDHVKRILIDDGITYIGDVMFEKMLNVESIQIPASVTKITNKSKEYGDTIIRKEAVIYGKNNTAASTYAKAHGNTFVALKNNKDPIDYYAGATASVQGLETIKDYLPKADEPNVYTLLTYDKKEIKTRAENGKGKVFVFYEAYEEEDKLPNSLFDQLKQTNIPYADVYFIGNPEWYSDSLELAKEQIESTYPKSFRNSFCLSNTSKPFFEYLQDKYSIGYPSVVIMDGESNIVYAESGLPDDLPALVNSLVTHKGTVTQEETPVDYGDFEKIGVCGNQAIWRYYSDGTLRISGKGNMWEQFDLYSVIGFVENTEYDGGTVGWVLDYINSSHVKRIVIDEGISYIGASMFSDMTNLKSITIPASVVKMPTNTYYDLFHWSIKPTVYGKPNSYAQKYANEYNLEFIPVNALGEPMYYRLAGAGRYQTAVEISKEGFPNGAKTVVLAYGLNYADALAGVSLAKAMNAPILLTNLKSLPAETLAEIKRLKATEVVILGGTGAVGAEVETALKKEGLKTERIAGGTRFETATKIAEKMQKLSGKAPQDIFFVYAFNSADALSVSAVAAVKGSPVIYLKTKGELDDATAAYLKSVKGKVKNAYVIGGTGVITDEMMKKAGDALGIAPQRVAGKNRFETCVEVNNTFKDVLDGNTVCVATGMDFPDALAGGVFAALNHAPLFLINGKAATLTLSNTQKSYLNDKSPRKLYVFGGTGAVPNSHIQKVASAYVPKPDPDPEPEPGSEPEPEPEPEPDPNNSTVYLQGGLLYIDESILGMTYAEVNECFGRKLPATEAWQWDAAFDSYLGYDFNGKGYILFFKDNILKAVRYEITAGTITDKMLSTYKANFGAYTQRADGNGYRFSAKNSTLEVYDNYYDNTSHIVIQYSIK